MTSRYESRTAEAITNGGPQHPCKDLTTLERGVFDWDRVSARRRNDRPAAPSPVTM